MKPFKCYACGRCCTQLKESTADMPGGLLLTPDEVKLFSGDDAKDIRPTVAYTVPGSDDKQIIYYGMLATRCPLYESGFGCTRYNDRPLICVRYPMGARGKPANANCRCVRDGGNIFDSSYQIARTMFDERTAIIMDSIPYGSILYIYNVEIDDWRIVGVKT